MKTIEDNFPSVEKPDSNPSLVTIKVKLVSAIKMLTLWVALYQMGL